MGLTKVAAGPAVRVRDEPPEGGEAAVDADAGGRPCVMSRVARPTSLVVLARSRTRSSTARRCAVGQRVERGGERPRRAPSSHRRRRAPRPLSAGVETPRRRRPSRGRSLRARTAAARRLRAMPNSHGAAPPPWSREPAPSRATPGRTSRRSARRRPPGRPVRRSRKSVHAHGVPVVEGAEGGRRRGCARGAAAPARRRARPVGRHGSLDGSSAVMVVSPVHRMEARRRYRGPRRARRYDDVVAFDLLVRNGTLVDGSGSPARPADVAVTGDRIAAIGDLGAVADADVARVIDASGHVVAPGSWTRTGTRTARCSSTAPWSAICARATRPSCRATAATRSPR